MRFLEITALYFITTILVPTASSSSFAGEKQDLASVNALISNLEGSSTVQVEKAVDLYDSIPMTSSWKPAAAQALVLAQIREKNTLKRGKF